MNVTRLFLIRHGQTDWNLQGKIMGQTDIGLNFTGILQAQTVGQFLKNKHIQFDAIYSSDLQRAQQSAHEIAEVLGMNVALVSSLREGYLGKLQGLTKQERFELYGPVEIEELLELAGAEPRAQVIERVFAFLDTIVGKHKEQNLVVVTHGWLLDSVLTHLGYTVTDLPVLTNDSITTLVWYEEHNRFLLESIEHAL